MADNATELASAYVSLSISTVDMGKQIVKGFGVADKVAAATGKTAGQGFAKAFGKTTEDVAEGLEAKLKAAGDAAEKASAKVKAARIAEDAAARKVRIEETKLSELREGGKATASAILAAEDKLATQRNRAALASDKAAQAHRGLADAQEEQTKAVAELDGAQDKAVRGLKGFGAKVKAALTGGKVSPLAGLPADAAKQGTKAGKRFGSSFNAGTKKLVAVAGIAGLGAAVKKGLGSAVGAAGDFDMGMATVAATLGESEDKVKGLTDLAMDMGAKTSFSAQGASDAMLELAKGGMTSAEIQGGVLASTLTLATAGGLELGDAAGYMVQGISGFGIEAGKASEIAAALAGAANASTASVQDIGTALSQVGPGAKTAGLSIQDTAAAIAAFTNNGMKGSDAGTSLKTFLTRLIPSTKATQEAFLDLGLTTFDAQKAQEFLRERGIKPLGQDQDTLTGQLKDYAMELSNSDSYTTSAQKKFNDLARESGALSNSFFDAQGNIKSMTDVSETLQNALQDQTKEQKIATLNTLFGSDAARAGAILSSEGAEGLTKYVKAVNDQGQAEKMAATATKGFNGAREALGGGIETLQIQIGTYLLPVLTRLMKYVTGTVIPKFGAFAEKVGPKVGPAIDQAVKAFGDLKGTLSDVGTFIRDNQGWFIALGGAIAGLTALVQIHSAVLFVTSGGLKAYLLGTKLVQAATKTWAAVQWVLNAALTANPIGLIVLGLVALGAGLVLAWRNSETFRAVVLKVWGAIKGAVAGVLDWFTGTLWPGIVSVWDAVSGAAVTAFDAVKGAVMGVVGWFTGTAIPAVSRVVSAIGGFFVGLYTRFILPAFNGIKAGITAVATVISAIWTGYISPIFQLVGAIVMWLAVKVFKFYLGTIMGAWRMLSTAISWAYENVVKPVISAFGVAVGWLKGVVDKEIRGVQRIWAAVGAALGVVYDKVIKPVIGFFAKRIAIFKYNFARNLLLIRLAWDALKNKILDVFNTYVKPIIDRFKSAVETLKNKVSETLAKIRGYWETLKNKLVGVWTDHVKPMLTKLKTGIGELGDKFKGAVTAIGEQWDKLKETAKKPIKFVIDTINEKLIGPEDGSGGGFNKLAKMFGTDPIKQIPGFATGGILPGRSSWRHGDSVPVMARPGEGWTVSEGLDAYEKGRLLALNRAALRGVSPAAFRARFDGQAQHFAKGGVVRPVNAPVPAWNGGRYKTGGWHGGLDFQVGTGTPVRAFMAGVVEAVKHWGYSYGNHVVLRHAGGVQSYYAHLSDTLGTKAGQNVGAGQLIGKSGNTGKSFGPHMHFEVRRPGENTPHGSDPHPYLSGATVPSGPLGAIGGVLGSMWDSLKATLTKPLAALKDGLGSSPVGQIAYGFAGKVVDGLKEKAMKIADFTDAVAGASKKVANTVAVARWTPTVIKALGIAGLPLSLTDNWLAQIRSESGGNPNAIQGAVGDVNNRSGDLAHGLVQVIGSTFAAYRDKSLPNNRFDPLANLVAGMRWAKLGRHWNAAEQERQIGHGHGYYTGTASARPGMAWVGERGPELVNFKGGEQVWNQSQLAAIGSAGAPLVGSLHIESRGTDIRADIDEALFQLRRIDRAGVHASR